MNKKPTKLEFSTILASSVHDMKNSLAMLLGSLTNISSGCDAGNCSIKNEISRMKHEGQRVNHDLIQLLSLYKIERHQYHLNSEEINIREYLEEISLEYIHLLNEHGIEVIYDCDSELFGYFDPELIAGVLKTILNNAYQYANDKIAISAKYNDGFIQLSITDNGGGYPPHMLCDQSAPALPVNFGTGSTGLGLYFATQVAQLHKNKDKTGYVHITNNANTHLKGGHFSIFLP